MISTTTIVTLSPDRRIILRDVITLRELCTLPPPDGGPRSRRRPEALSPDGRLLATVGAGLELWDVTCGERRPQLERTHGSYWEIQAVAFSADGRRLAAALAPLSELYTERDCVETVVVWDTDSGRQVHELLGDLGDRNPPFVTSVAFSPDGLILAAGTANESINLFDLATGERIRRLAVGSTINVLVFSPDGGILGSNNGLVDLASHARPHKLKGHADVITAMAFAPYDNVVATGSYDTTVKLWDRWSGRELRTLAGRGTPVVNVVFLPDGSTLASELADGAIDLWHAASGDHLRTLPASGTPKDDLPDSR